MSALSDIIAWARNEIPAWQGDAVRRMLTCEQLTKKDEDEIFLLMKCHLGLSSESEEIPQPILPSEEFVSGAQVASDKVVLKSVTCLNSINAIPDGNELPVGHEGLTLVYGENAAGKSGFARILKSACNARDKQEVVLGNIFETSQQRKPKAKFKIKVGDSADSFAEWEEGTSQVSPHISRIAVFDSKCARIIIDEKNEFSYKPYGSHVFEDLAALIAKLKNRLLLEKPQCDKPVIHDLHEGTSGYQLMQTLGTEQSEKSLPSFEKFSKEEEEQLRKTHEFIEAYKKNKIDEKIRILKDTVSKYVTFLREVKRVERATHSRALGEAEMAIKDFLTASQAQKIAEEAINSTDFPLPGVRTAAWRSLLEAAEKYSRSHAYPGKEFPVTEAEARCILCMQPLQSDAKARMLKFVEFIKDEVGANLRASTTTLQAVGGRFERLRTRQDQEVLRYINELSAYSNNLATTLVSAYHKSQARLGQLKKALNERVEFDLQPICRYDTKPILSWLRNLKVEVADLDKARMPKEIQEKMANYKELCSKKAIFSQIDNIRSFLSKQQKAQLIQSSADSLDTRAVSTRGRDIVSQACTPALQKELKDELAFLSANNPDVRFKARGSKGVTLHEVELAGAVLKYSPSKVLSEGEQKAVALAGFLAELSVSGHQYPIVFDDPVTSLDHKYRDKIAERIARESLKRQVVVFTHDIAFLVELEKHMGRLNDSKMTVFTVTKTQNKPGCIISSKPWHAMAVKDRLAYLESQIPLFSGLHGSDNQGYNTAAANWYGLLRETWEAIVEETVFNNTIRRFGAEVQTLRVKEVEISDVQYKTLDIGMSKASEWMIGHDKSKELSVNRPSPAELRDDIKETREFVNDIKKKREAIRERRDAVLRPQASAVG